MLNAVKSPRCPRISSSSIAALPVMDRRPRKPATCFAAPRSLDQNWSKATSRSAKLDSPETRAAGAILYQKIQELAPPNDFQRSRQGQALQIAVDVGRTRSLLLEQAGSAIPTPFLVVLVFWLAVIFTSFGLFAPYNTTVVATLFVCALSVSAAVFLILELDS